MFDDFYSGKRVLVTGHMGFKGSWLCVWLESLGAEVFGFSDQVPSSPSMFGELALADRLDHATGDVRDAEAVARRVADVKPEVVFHLAAQPIVRRSYEAPLETLATNVMGSANVLEAVRLAGAAGEADVPCRVVMVTSDKCYENVEWTYGYRETDALGGKDPYSASKGAAEVVVHAYHYSYFSAADSPVRIASARAGNVIGGGDWAANRLVPDCVRAWGRRESVEIRRPNATRPWQHVLEPLGGYLALGAALERDAAVAGESFNFGPPGEASHTVGALLEALASCWPAQETERLILAADQGVHEAGLLKLNCDKALHQLAWRPVWDFEETVSATAGWYLGYENAGGEGLLDFTQKQIKDYAARAAEKGIPWSQPSQS